mmetsp:Transcript_174640/g.560006  ORF Transcript_174640/g.560006 Transcript_174640/m.560006 type:complete len:299 (+) Transcript_174640:723-1619(+)
MHEPAVGQLGGRRGLSGPVLGGCDGRPFRAGAASDEDRGGPLQQELQLLCAAAAVRHPGVRQRAAHAERGGRKHLHGRAQLKEVLALHPLWRGRADDGSGLANTVYLLGAEGRGQVFEGDGAQAGGGDRATLRLGAPLRRGAAQPGAHRVAARDGDVERRVGSDLASKFRRRFAAAVAARGREEDTAGGGARTFPAAAQGRAGVPDFGHGLQRHAAAAHGSRGRADSGALRAAEHEGCEQHPRLRTSISQHGVHDVRPVAVGLRLRIRICAGSDCGRTCLRETHVLRRLLHGYAPASG